MTPPPPPDAAPGSPPDEATAGRWRAWLAYQRRTRMRSSQPRDHVVRTFFALDTHVTATELQARLADTDVGLSTIYRTLALLLEAGLATAHDFGGSGERRFEPVEVEEHHDHLVCERCGRIVEFMEAEIEELQRGVAERLGFELVAHRLDLFGRCPACRAPRGA